MTVRNDHAQSPQRLAESYEKIRLVALRSTQLFPNEYVARRDSLTDDDATMEAIVEEVLVAIWISEPKFSNKFDIAHVLDIPVIIVENAIATLVKNNIVDNLILNDLFYLSIIDNKKIIHLEKKYKYLNEIDLEKLFEEISKLNSKKHELIARFVDAIARVQPVTNATPIPVQPPESYSQRQRREETPPEFVQRVYGDWLDGSMSRPDLRKLDLQAYQALASWEQKNGPAEFYLPSIKEKNDALLLQSLVSQDSDKNLLRRRVQSMRTHKTRSRQM